MRLSLCALALLVGPVMSARAATVSCPDLGTAVQVGACPAEEELKYTFTGYCSDDAKAYKGDTDVCTDYQRYRKLKNIALWEAADGAFTAYLSCDLPTLGVRQAKASAVRVAKQGKITQLVCGYAEGVSFSYRTRAECKIDASGNCATDPAACKASCN